MHFPKVYNYIERNDQGKMQLGAKYDPTPIHGHILSSYYYKSRLHGRVDCIVCGAMDLLKMLPLLLCMVTQR